MSDREAALLQRIVDLQNELAKKNQEELERKKTEIEELKQKIESKAQSGREEKHDRGNEDVIIIENARVKEEKVDDDMVDDPPSASSSEEKEDEGGKKRYSCPHNRCCSATLCRRSLDNHPYNPNLHKRCVPECNGFNFIHSQNHSNDHRPQRSNRHSSNSSNDDSEDDGDKRACPHTCHCKLWGQKEPYGRAWLSKTGYRDHPPNRRMHPHCSSSCPGNYLLG